MTERLLVAERSMVKRIGTIFDQHDVLLTPVMAQPAIPAGVMEGRGATVTYLWETGGVPFTTPLEHHRSTAASVPAGYTRDGLRWRCNSSPDPTTRTPSSRSPPSLRPNARGSTGGRAPVRQMGVRWANDYAAQGGATETPSTPQRTFAATPCLDGFVCYGQTADRRGVVA